jgi:hypothetical protein
MNTDDGMGGFHEPSALLPCRNCLVTWMQAGIESVDGAPMDAGNGMWLHHAVFVNKARKDTVCGEDYFGQRFFATGNERTAVDLCSGG